MSFSFLHTPVLQTTVSLVGSGWMVQKDVDSLTNIHTPKIPTEVSGWDGDGWMENVQNLRPVFSQLRPFFIPTNSMETTTLYLAAQSLISFRPASVSTYFCFDEFGLSGIVGVARWVSKSIFKHVCLNLVRLDWFNMFIKSLIGISS